MGNWKNTHVLFKLTLERDGTVAVRQNQLDMASGFQHHQDDQWRQDGEGREARWK